MAAIKKERPLLKLSVNNCESFVVNGVVAAKDFRQDVFLKNVPHDLAETYKHGNPLSGYFARQSKQIDYDAYINIHKAEQDKSSPKVHFQITLRRGSRQGRAQSEPPFAEEVFQWVHRLVSPDATISLREHADFTFPLARYRSVFSLPSVLLGPLNSTQNEVFEGVELMGLVLMPQNNKVGVDLAAQSVIGKSIAVTLDRTVETQAQKLLSIETDVAVLHTIAISTVRLKRRTKK